MLEETLGYIMMIDVTFPENEADSRKQVSMCMHEKKTDFLWVSGFGYFGTSLAGPLSVFYCYAGNQEKS